MKAVILSSSNEISAADDVSAKMSVWNRLEQIKSVVSSLREPRCPPEGLLLDAADAVQEMGAGEGQTLVRPSQKLTKKATTSISVPERSKKMLFERSCPPQSVSSQQGKGHFYKPDSRN